MHYLRYGLLINILLPSSLIRQISPYLKDSDYIERTIREQQITMFIVKGIPENSYFETQTRKEIGVK